MTNIHLIGGEKGGVGKSVVARLLAQYLIDRQMPFLGFDTDRSHGALLRFYAGYASQVPVDSYDAMDQIVEAAVDVPERRILVDLAAQTHDPLVKWIDESGVLDMAEEVGLSFNYWHVMDSGRDSVDLLRKLLDRFGRRLQYRLVRNELRGDDFSILDQSGEQARALELGARIVKIRRLHDSVMQKIDGSSASFWSAAYHADKDTTGHRPDGPAAGEAVAARCLPRTRQRRRLTPFQSDAHSAQWKPEPAGLAVQRLQCRLINCGFNARCMGHRCRKMASIGCLALAAWFESGGGVVRCVAWR